MRLRAGPSRIFGECPAGHRMDDEFIIDEMAVHAVKGPICYIALSAFTDQVAQKLRGENVTSHVSCPGCWFIPDKENRVVFVLSIEDTWSLSKKYSEYNWGRKDGRATKASEHYCNLCWELTKAGNYVEAERIIEQAIKYLKPSNSPI